MKRRDICFVKLQKSDKVEPFVTCCIKFKSSFTSLLEAGADKASLGIKTATAKTTKAISETLFLDS